MATYNHFCDLPVSQKCRLFRKKGFQIVKKHFPESEDFHLKTQVSDSGRSITAYMAEGFGGFHYQENIQFCRQSTGSLTETMDHLITAFDEEYINTDQLKILIR